MVNRLKGILSDVISEEEKGFVPRGCILDGIVISQEVVYYL